MVTTHYNASPPSKRFVVCQDIHIDYYRIIDRNNGKFFRIGKDNIHNMNEFDLARILGVREVNEDLLECYTNMVNAFVLEKDKNGSSYLRQIKLPPEKQKQKEKKNELVENTVWFRDAEDVADETRDLRLKHISELELNMRKHIETSINKAMKNTFTSVRVERSDFGLIHSCFRTDDEWDKRFNFKPNEISALKTIKAELKSLGYKVKLHLKEGFFFDDTPYIEIDWSKPKKRKGRL